MSVSNTFMNVMGLVRIRSWPSFMLCFLGGLSFLPNPLSEIHLRLLDSRYHISVIGFALLLGYTFALNQCFDTKEDALHNEKKRLPVVSGQMSVSTAFGWTLVFLIGGGTAMFAVSKTSLGVLLYILAWTVYSIPKFRFKEKAGLDLVSNGVGGGLSFLIGSSVQSSVDVNSLFLSGIIALMYGSGYVFHSCADYESDRLAGVKTTCVRIGKKKSLLLAATLNAVMGVVFVAGIVLLPFPKHYLVLTVFPAILFLLLAKADVNTADSLATLQRRVVYLGYSAGVSALMLHFFF